MKIINTLHKKKIALDVKKWSQYKSVQQFYLLGQMLCLRI
jgi:glutaredoxin-related protein